jgi:MFS family permease
MGLVSIAGGVSAYFLGKLADVGNKPRILLATYATLSLVPLLYIYTPSNFAIYCLHAIYGISASSAILLENVLISLYTPANERGKGMGFLSGVRQVGIGLAMIVGGFLVAVVGVSKVFALVSVIILVACLVVARIKSTESPERPTKS